MRRLALCSLDEELSEEPSLNITPLIDVVFVVLFAFIIIAPLMEYEEVELAEANAATVQRAVGASQRAIVIGVAADNGVTVDKQAVSLELLSGLLTRLHRSDPEAVLHLFHDRRASFGTYQSVKNAAEGAGFASMEVFLVEK